MKTYVFILLLLLVFLSEAFTQTGILDRKVKIEANEGTVGSLLTEIGKKGGFVFTYGHDIPQDDYVVLHYSRQTVQGFLNELFGEDLYCVEYGNKLIIRLKPKLPEVYTIRGKVVDAETKVPLPGVTVLIPDSEPLIGSVSDRDGLFQIDVPTNVSAVQLSCIGYESNSLQPGKNKNVNVELSPESQVLEQVEIVYYRKPKSEDINSAVSNISIKQLEKVKTGNIDEVLQGNVAGVHVVRNSGMPGSSIQIKIRGINSLICSDPVYYLDGIYIQSTSLYAISSNDIESIDVIKDASGTARYGASAGNGVVLLHSKQAKSKKTGVSFDFSYGLQKAWKMPELMDSTEFLKFFREVHPRNNTYDKLDSLRNTDWMDVIFHEAKTENFHLAFHGGNDRSDFYVSSGYFGQEAIINALELKRYSIKVSSDHDIREGFTFGEDISIAYLELSGLKEGCFLNDFNNPIVGAMCMSPVKSPDDSRLFWQSDESMIKSMYDNVELNNNSRKNYALTARLNSQVRILPAIHYTTRLGIDVYFQDNISFNRRISVSNDSPDMIYGSSYNILDYSFDWQHSLEYTANFSGNHSLHTTMQFEFGQSKSEWIPVNRHQYNDSLEIIYDPTSSSNTAYEEYHSATEFSHRAWSGFVQYAFKNRYQLKVDLCREISGFYYEGRKRTVADWYPSVSLGWIFTAENFIPLNVLNYGKIRYGWGRTGNSPRINYSFYAKMMRDMDYVYSFDNQGTIINSAYQRQTNVKYFHEIIHSHNIGLDLGFWQNRFFLSVDYFNTRLNWGKKFDVDNLDNIIRIINQKDEYGIIPPPVAEMYNRGFEFELSYKHTVRNLGWDIGLNFTHLKNKVIQLESDTYNPTKSAYDPISVHFAGETAGSFYGWEIDRIFTSADCDTTTGLVVNHPDQPGAKAGDYKYVDGNEDGKIDDNDRRIIGNPFPDFTFGFYCNLQFRSFDLSVFFQGTYGNEIFNAINMWLYNPYSLSNWAKGMANTYREPDNTNTSLHRYDPDNTNENLRVSDFYVEDGSYLRLKNIQIGYTLPVKLTKRIHIQKFRIWLGAQNLLTWTNYSGLDPEVGGWGIDCGNYPQPRVYLAGVNVEF